MPAISRWPSHPVMRLLEEPAAKERLAHRDVVFPCMAFEAESVRHRFEHHAAQGAQHLGSDALASLGFGQTQIKQRGSTVLQVFQDHHATTLSASDGPVALPVFIPEMAAIDSCPHVSFAGRLMDMEREAIGGEELDQIVPISGRHLHEGDAHAPSIATRVVPVPRFSPPIRETTPCKGIDSWFEPVESASAYSFSFPDNGHGPHGLLGSLKI